MEGVLPKVRCQIIADFYGKKSFKGKDVNRPSFQEDGTQEKNAFFRVMLLVDAGELVTQRESCVS